MTPLSPFNDGAAAPVLDESVWFEDAVGQLEGEDAWPAPGGLASPFAEAAEGPVAEAAGPHPILDVYRLAPGVLDALSDGSWSLAVSRAVAAGLRDVNVLTNIVFLFRHPDVIGRKIRPDERAYAAEWVSIRDRIVKPALSGTADPAPSRGPRGPRPDFEAWAQRLRWPEATSEEQVAFMRAVYVRQSERAWNAGSSYVLDLPEAELRRIEGDHRGHVDMVPWARAMLAAARIALTAEHGERYRIGIVSAYRPASLQFKIWQGPNPTRGFRAYYAQALAKGIVRRGDYSPAAVERFARYLGGYIAAPGFSNHQDGLALDLGTGLGTDRYLRKIGAGSWFHRWLNENGQANARRFHFEPLASEEWHWTYRGGPGRLPASQEVPAAGVRADRLSIARVPLLRRHRGKPPDLVLRWNDMPSAPEAIDVVVHFHGFGRGTGVTLGDEFEPHSGLGLQAPATASGRGRTRPTLTVLPRGYDTGVANKYGMVPFVFPAIVGKKPFNALVDLSLEQFAARVGGAKPRLARLILTAHSGGHAALLQVLAHQNPHEVHLFDALYEHPRAVERWAKSRIARDRDAIAAGRAPSGALRVVYGKSTPGWSRWLARALEPELERSPAALRRCYRVERSPYGHWRIPASYGWRLLADPTADLPEAYREKLAQRELELDEAGELAGEWAYEALVDEHGDHPPELEDGDVLELEHGGAFEDVVLEQLGEPSDGEAPEQLGEADEGEELEQLGEPGDGDGFEHEGLGLDDDEAATPDELVAHAAGEVLGEEFAGEAAPEIALEHVSGVALESELVGIGSAIRRAYELGVLAARVKAGQRDPKDLTNAIFYLRHPDREGTRIAASERELAREWAEIRMRMVLPLLLSGPAIGPMHGGGTPPGPELRKGVPAGAEISDHAITLRGLRRARYRQPGGIAAVVVHCTSRGPVSRAAKAGYSKPAVTWALNWYLNGDGGFPHYVIDFNGTIYATCDERFAAHHSGWVHAGGRALFERGDWRPPAWWSSVWSAHGVRTPVDLVPSGARSPNYRTIGVELMILPDLSYTPEQYRSLARLVVDVAQRNPDLRIPSAPSRGLLGHEDFAPVKGEGGRENAGGGWDPGAHRADPYFSWARVWTEIQQIAPGFGAGHGASRELLDGELFADELLELERIDDDVPL